MKVQSIQIVNFKGIGEMSISPNGNNVYAIGPNKGGKTSFIDAVFKTLTGKNLPSKLTKDGERKGSVKIDLGDLLVEASFDNRKEKMNLSVSAPEGGKYDAPRTMLDSLVGVVDFDVAAFLSMTPRKQVEQLKTIVGLDLSDLDQEYKKYYDQRAESNRELKWLENNSKPYDSTKTEFVDEAELNERRNALRVANATRKAKQEEEERLTIEIDQDSKRLEKLKLEAAELDARITEKVNRSMDVETWLEENPYTPDDVIVAAIEEARKHNQQVENTQKELAHRGNIKDEQRKNEALNMKLEDIEARKAERIKSVKMPVDGLSFTEEGLVLNGLPFESEQVNTASQIIAGLQICSALHKDVHIARFDGSLLDKNSMAQVEEWAASKGIQLFVELVDREAEGGLKIVVSE